MSHISIGNLTHLNGSCHTRNQTPPPPKKEGKVVHILTLTHTSMCVQTHTHTHIDAHTHVHVHTHIQRQRPMSYLYRSFSANELYYLWQIYANLWKVTNELKHPMCLHHPVSCHFLLTYVLSQLCVVSCALPYALLLLAVFSEHTAEFVYSFAFSV